MGDGEECPAGVTNAGSEKWGVCVSLIFSAQRVSMAGGSGVQGEPWLSQEKGGVITVAFMVTKCAMVGYL